DDPSREWMTLGGINHRVEVWCRKAPEGFDPADQALDAHRYFETSVSALAVFDLDAFRPTSGFADAQMDGLFGKPIREHVVELRPGLVAGLPLRGQWYYRDRVTLPPRNLEQFVGLLGTGQRRNFERGLQRLRSGADGALQFAALIWPRYGELDSLVLLFK